MCAYDGADYQRLKQPIVDALGPDCGFAQLRETEAGEVSHQDSSRRNAFVYLDDKDFFGHSMKHMVKHLA